METKTDLCIFDGMKPMLITALLLLSAVLNAQSSDTVQAILQLTGATDAEELDEEVLERFSVLAAHPVDLNHAGRQSLLACGLFTAFQVASLMEARPLRSYMELALTDGFSPALAAALQPFTRIDDRETLSPAPAPRHDALALAGWKDDSWQAGAKYRFATARLTAGAALRRSGDGKLHTGCSIGWTGRRTRLWLGDFNARFGQGLCLWNGFSLSSLASVDAFGRRPTGLSQAWSWSDAPLRGVAGELSLGRFSIRALAAIPVLRSALEGGPVAEEKVLPAGNVTGYFRCGSAGVTASYRGGTLKVGGDVRVCLRGTDLFTEVAWDVKNRSPGLVAGTLVPLGTVRLAALFRYYGRQFSADGAGAVRSGTRVSDECGAALGASWETLSLTVDAVRKLTDGKRTLKIVALAAPVLSPSLTCRIRLSERLRDTEPVNRTDLRADLCWTRGPWRANLRGNIVWSSRFGILGYGEGGYQAGQWTLWLRGTLFRADQWDDRIYAYERDLPGFFSVPAYYGRGWAGSVSGSLRWQWSRVRLKIAFRGELTRYPWMETEKPGRAGLRMLLSCQF